MTYAQDLQAQIMAIEQSNLTPETWIETHAAAWRAAHPIDDLEFEEFDAHLSALEHGL